MPAQVRVRRSTYTQLPAPPIIRRETQGGTVSSAPQPEAPGSPAHVQFHASPDLHASPDHTEDGHDAHELSMTLDGRRASIPVVVDSSGSPIPSLTPNRARTRSRTIQSIFDPVPLPEAVASAPSPSASPAPASPTPRGRNDSTASGTPSHPTSPPRNTASRVRAATISQRARSGSVTLGAGSGSAAVDVVRGRSGSVVSGGDRVSLAEAREAVVKVPAVGDVAERTKEEVEEAEDEEHHHEEVVEHLDVIDAEVSAVSHLQNAANTVMFPHIPQLWSRKAVVTLPEAKVDEEMGASQPPNLIRAATFRRASLGRAPPSTLVVPTADTASIHSTTPLPISPSDLALDTHVEDCLRKRDKVKRTLKGVWKFLKTPLGIVAGIYMFNVIFWGAAIVLFLAKWINAGSDYYQKLWIEITCQIENGLFSITNIGLIPWRLIDARRITIIWILRRRSRKLREKRGLPPIDNIDDLPDPRYDPDFVPVLTESDQARLQYQQEKFMASQTWYRPHATETHRAFSIDYAVAICFNIVGNSLFQCALSGCMWGLNRYNRPAWTTGLFMPLSFVCMIVSGVLIWLGGERTKKTKEVEEKLREALGMEDEDDKEVSSGTETGEMEMKKVGNGEAAGGSVDEEKSAQGEVEVPKKV